MQTCKKWMAVALAGAAMLAGASAVQAQVTIGAPITPGVYGQIVIGNGAPPPLYSPAPIIVQPAPAPLEPVYLYVPDHQRQRWAHYCGQYRACNRPVYFVNGRSAEARRYHYYQAHPARLEERREYRHDNGRHLGWERGRGNPHRRED